MGSDSPSRQEGMRCLVSCLSGLIQVASKHSTTHDPPPRTRDSSKERSTSPSRGTTDLQIQPERGASVGSVGGRRNLISPETWQETLAILVEADYGLRADYARTLAMFINSEIPKEQPLSSPSSSLLGSRTRGAADLSAEDETIRFLHAMHATVYTLAVAPTLGLSATAAMVSDRGDMTNSASSMTESSPASPITPVTRSGTDTDTDTTDTNPTVQLNFIDSTPVQSPTAEEPTPASTMSFARGHKASIADSGMHPRSTHRSRTASLALSLIDPIEHSGTQLVSPASAPAYPNDYSHVVAIMSSAVKRTPARAILTGVPMLLALDKLSCAALVNPEDDVLRGRRQAMREGIAQVWAVIASTIDSPELSALSRTVRLRHRHEGQ